MAFLSSEPFVTGLTFSTPKVVTTSSDKKCSNTNPPSSEPTCLLVLSSHLTLKSSPSLTLLPSPSSLTAPRSRNDVFITGTFKPSTGFTCGYRVCNYLDPSEPKHGQIKSFLLALVASRKDQVIPLLRNYLMELFVKIEDKVSEHGEVYFNPISQNEMFNFLFHLYCGKPPSQTTLKSDGLKLFQLWVYAQVCNLMITHFSY